MSDHGVVRFHGFVLDAERRVVTRDGSAVHLTPKAFDLLTTLIEQSPRVVPKEELHRRLWPETFVTDSTVSGVIKELRRALGNHHGGEPLIRTAHGVGFAFAGIIHGKDIRPLAYPRYCLITDTGRVMLAEGANDIGRDADVAVWLDSSTASRRHARLTVAADAVTVEDLGSKNGTLLNDRLVTEPTRLCDGDAIRIGSAVFVFRAANSVAPTDTAESGAEA